MMLQAISGAPDYLPRMSEVIARLSEGDETEFVGLLREATARLGAGASYFMSFVREDETFASYRILLACDPVWGLEYDHAGCHSSDPWLHHAMHHSEPLRGSEIPCAGEPQRAVVRLAAQFGFRSAVVVPAPVRGGVSRLGVLVLGSAEPGYFEGAGYGPFKVLARALAMELHERCLALIRSELLSAGAITDQELDLLRHEHDGRCSKTIARMTGTSPNAVDRRFYRLNAKLGSPNRKVSTRLAVEYGLI
jgi:DNA-binding CsgD family transcriptional regulator